MTKLKQQTSKTKRKNRYDIEIRYGNAKEELAGKTEASIESYDNPEVKDYLAKQAAELREDGRAVIEAADANVKEYVKKNNGYYYDRAKSDMEADLAMRPGLEEQMATTRQDIQDLPESKGPNN
jgi:hypothetical protein